MSQSQIQEQRQEQKLQQAISAQQLLQAQLVEMPIQQLSERVEAEMHDNPALESVADDEEWNDYQDYPEPQESTDESEDFEMQRELEERSDALDAALEGIGRDDEDLPVFQGGQAQDETTEEPVYGAGQSFYDLLLEQVGELELSERNRYVMEYLIRSLDDDGLLRIPLEDIVEELAIYHSIDISTEEVERVLRSLQQLDPAGIGARSLQECLLLQIDRALPSAPLSGGEYTLSTSIKAQNTPSTERNSTKALMREVIASHFDEFTKKHWDKIRQSMNLSEEQFDEVIRELRRLNPKPGASMGEVVGRSIQQIIPDFIVDTQDDGTVTFTLNQGDVPQLHVSQSFADMMKEYQQNREGMSRQMKEALLYIKQKVDAAQGFIAAVKTRRRTLALTMQAIIDLQHRFFEEGDEASLRPMILKDVAERTGLDLSTISRVTNSKFAQTRWGTFPLKYFFSDGVVTESGEELSQREIKSVLREIIDSEDKRSPLSDDTLSEVLRQRGYPIARRTVAKYREQMNIPVARLRR